MSDITRTVSDITDWTAEELALIDKAREYFQAIAKVEEAKGRTQEALLAAMPAEVAAQMGGDMHNALGGLG